MKFLNLAQNFRSRDDLTENRNKNNDYLNNLKKITTKKVKMMHKSLVVYIENEPAAGEKENRKVFGFQTSPNFYPLSTLNRI